MQIGRGGWTTEIPSDWEVEEDDVCLSTWRADGVGALQFSSARKTEGDVTLEDVRQRAADDLQRAKSANHVVVGDFSGLELRIVSEDRAWRIWHLMSGSLMLYATYNCEIEDAGAEDLEVDAILRRLQQRAS